MITLADELRPHVEAITKAATAGDAAAQQIISLYQLHVRCPSDPGAPGLCAGALHEWLAKKPCRVMTAQDSELSIHDAFIDGPLTKSQAIGRLLALGYSEEEARETVGEWADAAREDNSQFGVGA